LKAASVFSGACPEAPRCPMMNNASLSFCRSHSNSEFSWQECMDDYLFPPNRIMGFWYARQINIRTVRKFAFLFYFIPHLN